MITDKTNSILIKRIVSIFFIIIFCSFTYIESDIKNKFQEIELKDTVCDPELWKRVYNPERLKILVDCKVVTGIIEERGSSRDGDEHMLLKLDYGQEDLLYKRNYKKKKGNLVIEVICANNATKKAAKKSCQGYLNNIQIPEIGKHVRVTGSYVVDSHNGWTEIHPVSKIEVIE